MVLKCLHQCSKKVKGKSQKVFFLTFVEIKGEKTGRGAFLLPPPLPPSFSNRVNDFLKLDNSVTIHQRNLQILATEICKLKNSLAPDLMTEVFEIKEPHYNLSSDTSHFKRANVKIIHYGI